MKRFLKFYYFHSLNLIRIPFIYLKQFLVSYWLHLKLLLLDSSSILNALFSLFFVNLARLLGEISSFNILFLFLWVLNIFIITTLREFLLHHIRRFIQTFVEKKFSQINLLVQFLIRFQFLVKHDSYIYIFFIMLFSLFSTSSFSPFISLILLFSKILISLVDLKAFNIDPEFCIASTSDNAIFLQHYISFNDGKKTHEEILESIESITGITRLELVIRNYYLTAVLVGGLKITGGIYLVEQTSLHLDFRLNEKLLEGWQRHPAVIHVDNVKDGITVKGFVETTYRNKSYGTSHYKFKLNSWYKEGHQQTCSLPGIKKKFLLPGEEHTKLFSKIKPSLTAHEIAKIKLIEDSKIFETKAWMHDYLINTVDTPYMEIISLMKPLNLRNSPDLQHFNYAPQFSGPTKELTLRNIEMREEGLEEMKKYAQAHPKLVKYCEDTGRLYKIAHTNIKALPDVHWYKDPGELILTKEEVKRNTGIVLKDNMSSNLYEEIRDIFE